MHDAYCLGCIEQYRPRNAVIDLENLVVPSAEVWFQEGISSTKTSL